MRPPGAFGEAAELLVRSVVDAEVRRDSHPRRQQLPAVHIVPSASAESAACDAVVRSVTLPVQLEAVELALLALERLPAPRRVLDARDVLAAVRLLVQWHCRISRLARNTSSIILSSKMTLSHPPRGRRALRSFLFGAPTPPYTEDAYFSDTALDGAALRALARIDSCTAAANAADSALRGGDGRPSLSLDDAVELVIEEELRDASCGEAVAGLEPRSVAGMDAVSRASRPDETSVAGVLQRQLGLNRARPWSAA
jgi:hypothetical protein